MCNALLIRFESLGEAVFILKEQRKKKSLKCVGRTEKVVDDL